MELSIIKMIMIHNGGDGDDDESIRDKLIENIVRENDW